MVGSGWSALDGRREESIPVLWYHILGFVRLGMPGGK
jgi:hypothetical protein